MSDIIEPLTYEQRKEQARRRRQLQKAADEAELQIAAIEEQITAIETLLTTPEGASDASLYIRYEQLKSELSDVMDKWAEASEALEKLEN